MRKIPIFKNVGCLLTSSSFINFFAVRSAFALLFILFAFSQSANAARFNRAKDILIAQFDNKPDADDIQAQAALASILLHPDAAGVKYYVVTGAYGSQTGKYIDSNTLLTMAYGTQNGLWTDANKDLAASVTRIKDKVKPILLAGGKAWVQEAGESDVTLLWINALIADGVPAATVKSNVMVVQHSDWNESKASAGVLNSVKQKSTYITIDDGNNNPGAPPSRGNITPNYKSGTGTTDLQYLKNAIAATNPNKTANKYWTEAKRIIVASGFNETYSPIDEGGLDFSDAVEAWFILELGDNAGTINTFWNRYVVNVPTSNVTLRNDEKQFNVKYLSGGNIEILNPYTKAYNVEVMNLNGQVLLRKMDINTENFNFTLSVNSAAMYFVHISNGTQSYTQKLIVK